MRRNPEPEQQRPETTWHSMSAEQAVLGSMLLEGEAVDTAARIVKPEDFGWSAHRLLFRAMAHLRGAGQPVDLVTLREELERRQLLDRAGGPSYLLQLLEALPTAAHVDYYARIVLERAKARRLRESIQSAADALTKGGTPADVIARMQAEAEEIAGRDSALRAPQTYSAGELLAMDLPEPASIIDGWLYEGMTILAGPPKIGKSWLVLQLAVSIACGARALGQFPCTEGEVLYLALEDGPRRLQDRLSRVISGDPGITQEVLSRIHFRTEWPRMDLGGIGAIGAWLQEHPACVAVFIDTLQRVRAPATAQGTAYQDDSAAMVPIHQLSKAHPGVGVLLIHHTRKSQGAGGGDALEEVSGSLGISGVADATIVLRRPRGEEQGTMEITGRDPVEQRASVKFSQGLWSYVGDAADVQETEERQQIIDVLTEEGRAMQPHEIARAIGKPSGSIRRLVVKMRQTGALRKAGFGKYELSADTCPPDERPSVRNPFAD